MQTNTSSAAIPFRYSVVSDAMVANGTSTKTLVLGIDAIFELAGFAASSSLDVSTQTQYANNFSVLIRDLTTGKSLMNAAMPRSLVAGNAINNFLYEGRRIQFPAANQFQFDFINLDGSSANTVTFALLGYKIYPNTPDNPVLA